jgi:hypothetical protein
MSHDSKSAHAFRDNIGVCDSDPNRSRQNICLPNGWRFVRRILRSSARISEHTFEEDEPVERIYVELLEQPFQR